jgi:mannitol-specific phosphotransferase system IIBC component
MEAHQARIDQREKHMKGDGTLIAAERRMLDRQQKHTTHETEHAQSKLAVSMEYSKQQVICKKTPGSIAMGPGVLHSDIHNYAGRNFTEVAVRFLPHNAGEETRLNDEGEHFARRVTSLSARFCTEYRRP